MGGGEKRTWIDIAQPIGNMDRFGSRIPVACNSFCHLRALGCFPIHLLSLMRHEARLTFLVNIISGRPCPSSARVLVPIGLEASQYPTTSLLYGGNSLHKSCQYGRLAARVKILASKPSAKDHFSTFTRS